MKSVGDITPIEALIFGHWIVILQLLKLGIPWEAINDFTPQQVSLLMGIQAALNEEESDRMKSSSHVNSMHSQMESMPAWK